MIRIGEKKEPWAQVKRGEKTEIKIASSSEGFTLHLQWIYSGMNCANCKPFFTLETKMISRDKGIL